MSAKKIIVVFGATGAQGGGVARAILNDPNSEYAVRAVTRDPNSDKAKALASQGAEVVAADIDDAASIRAALNGAYGAFFVTFFWDHFSPEKEQAQARMMAEAAKEANLQHVIWSTLEDTRQFVPLEDNRMPTLMGKYKVPHLDSKGEANQYFTDLGVPTTFLLTSFYWENFIYFGLGVKRGEDGNLYLTLPMDTKDLSGIASEDIGKCAYGIFKRGAADMAGKKIGVAGQQINCADMAQSMAKVLGEPVIYNQVTPEQFRNFGFPGADDLGNMFQFFAEFEPEMTKVRNVQFSKELNPELQNFDQWIAENAQRMPL